MRECAGMVIVSPRQRPEKLPVPTPAPLSICVAWSFWTTLTEPPE